jgi:hypothetical protein
MQWARTEDTIERSGPCWKLGHSKSSSSGGRAIKNGNPYGARPNVFHTHLPYWTYRVGARVSRPAGARQRIARGWRRVHVDWIKGNPVSR